MALIEKSGSLITITNLTKTTPLSTFFIRLEPLSRVSENVNPYNTNILYDSREIDFHIFNTNDSTDYQHLFFSQFTDTINPDVMYYGTLQYSQYSGLFYVYEKVRVPSKAITWVKSDGLWHGTVDERYRGYGNEGCSEFYNYVISYDEVKNADDYTFTVDGIDIYVKDNEHAGDSEEAWLDHLKYCTFCYAINGIHFVTKLEELKLPAAGSILTRPYSCTITYESSEAAQTHIMNSKQVWPDDINNITVATISNTSLAKTENALPMPPKNLTITLPIVQEGEGTPSPDNPRPFKIYDTIHVDYQGVGSEIFDFKTYYNSLNDLVTINEETYEQEHPYQVTLNEDGSVTATAKTFMENPWQVPAAYAGYRFEMTGYLDKGWVEYSNKTTREKDEQHRDGWYLISGVSYGDNPNTMPDLDLIIDDETYIRITYKDAQYSDENEDTIITVSDLKFNWLTGDGRGKSFDISLPKNTIGGVVDLVEGTVFKQTSVGTQMPVIDGVSSISYNQFSFWLLDTNNCPIVSVQQTEATDGNNTQTLYVAELEFPPNVPIDFYTNVDVKNNGWLCSHYDIGAGGAGVYTVNSSTNHLQIFDTRFDTMEHALKYLHDPLNPIYFVIRRFYNRYYDSIYEDIDYFYSSLTETALNYDTVVKMNQNYNLSYYTNTVKRVAAIESRITALENQEKSKI